jgi:hypothetical protein
VTSVSSVELRGWAPDDIDLDRPSAARVYDYYLGGSHNYAVDRAVARRIVDLVPQVPRIARANRSFLRRVVEYLVAAGIRQFLDIGSGIPTAGNVHEIAQRADPGARVVYVDIDRVAVAHSRTVLAGDDRVAVVHEDLRAPDRVLSDPDLRRVLDLDRPVAVLMIAMLHFIGDDDDPAGVVEHYRDAVVPGSYLAISHIQRVDDPVPAGVEVLDVYAEAGTPLTPRTDAELMRLFGEFPLVEPGLVGLTAWHPEPIGDGPDPDAGATDPRHHPRMSTTTLDEWVRDGFRAGVGRKP